MSLEQLERFERETARAAEAAFNLAHNAGVSRFIMDAARAPDVDEVAFALDDPEDGPFLVARRDGAPIRCLKRGARPRLPVVTRAMIERAVQPHDNLRAQVARWSATAPTDTGFRVTFRRLFDEGDRVPREVLRSLAPFLPLFGERLPTLWYACDDAIRDFVKRAGERLLADRHRLEPREKEQVRRTWRLHWAVGHLQALFAQVDDDQLRQTSAAVIQGAAPMRAMRFGYWPVALRGLSLCARLGPTLLTGLERGLKLPPDAINEALPSAHGLGFVGAAHPKYRSEIATLLGAVPNYGDPRSEWLARDSEVLAEALVDLVTDENDAARRLRDQLLALGDRGLGEDLPPEVTAPEVEDPHALVVALANHGLDHHGRLARVLLRHGLGAFARSPIEDLYRTSAELARMPASDPLEDGFGLLRVAIDHLARLRGSRPG